MTQAEHTGTRNIAVLQDKIHLRDLTQGNAKQAACGAKDVNLHDILVDSAFVEVPLDQRCKKCEAELREARAYELTCQVCRVKFPSPEALAEHNPRTAHALISVSYRKQKPTFVIDLQGHCDKHYRNARALAQAREELMEFFPHLEFDFLPGRLMLTTYGADSLILGEAHVALYHVIPRT